MNQLAHHTEKQIEKINPNDVSGALKGLAPRSFEKTFNGLTTKQVEYAFSLCIQGLTREQIAIGMNAVVENGFCPDPAMFRKWCLGIKGFINDVDPVRDSYKGKYAALANIEAWRTKASTSITNAEREAYNRVYGMFQDMEYANNHEKQKFYAYEAFKDAYSDVVKELVAKDEKQSVWDPSLEIQVKKKPVISFGIDYINCTDDARAFHVCRDGFNSVVVLIKKSDVYEHMKTNGGRNFEKAESELLSLEMKKIKWVEA